MSLQHKTYGIICVFVIKSHSVRVSLPLPRTFKKKSKLDKFTLFHIVRAVGQREGGQGAPGRGQALIAVVRGPGQRREGVLHRKLVERLISTELIYTIYNSCYVNRSAWQTRPENRSFRRCSYPTIFGPLRFMRDLQHRTFKYD